MRSSSLSLVLTLFFGFFVSHSQPESECDSQSESECEHFSVSKLSQFDYSYVGILKHRCVDLSSAVSLALSLALSLPQSLLPFPQYTCSVNFFHSFFCSLSPAIPRKVDSQLQSRIRRHVPKDSFLIYNCAPRKLKKHSSQNQMAFAIFSTL